jgi:hypothetical protein
MSVILNLNDEPRMIRIKIELKGENDGENQENDKKSS